jgi:glycosyltransferase involved in cell wall biosynthesis
MVGPVEAEMSALIRQYATASVRFEGFVSPDRLADIYTESDVFAFPSVNEGLARVLLEAMASGLPVVASNLSGAEDCVTQGVDGRVVPARDVDALVEALLWHYENRDATRQMGKAAKANIAARFSLPHYEERMIRMYQSVTEKKL